MTNYIPDVNSFKLAGPPLWFLRLLWDFDQSLVIVPSRQGFYYRLAQRRKLLLPEKMVNDMLWQHSDTQMLASYGLVPVTTILATANWGNPMIFAELNDRAPWRNGGAEKVIKHIEGMEHEKERKDNQVIDERNTYLAKDSWKLYRKAIGLGRTYIDAPGDKPVAPLKPTGKPAVRKLFYPD